jgi:hypothetical protein
MAITSETARVQYTLSTTNQALSVTFRFNDATDLRVVKTSSDVDTALTNNTHYTVSGGDGSTGTVTMIGATVGDTITIYRNLPLTQGDEYESNQPLSPSTIEGAFDKVMAAVQQVLLQVKRSLRIPVTNAELAELSKTSRARKIVAFDEDGALDLIDATLADQAAESAEDAERFAEAAQQALADLASESPFGMINVRWSGASQSKTNAENRAILQTVIADAPAGGVIIVPQGIDYGFIHNDVSTYPDFSSRTEDCIVYDYGTGDADGSGNKSGAQVRCFFFTKQTTPAGIHDGNGHVINGDWHPYFEVNNTSDLAAVGDPSRTADDNRRASFFTFIDGVAVWRIAQGTLAGAGYTDEELSNFCIEQFGGTLGDYAPLVIERKTGKWSFGSGRNAPTAAYDFQPVAAGQGFVKQSTSHPDDDECQDSQVNSKHGTGIRYRLKQLVWELFVEGVGTALSINLSTRATSVSGPLILGSYAQLKGYEVASLPALSAGDIGAMAIATDCTSTASAGLGTNPTGGGANRVPVYWDGSAWVML